MDHSGSDIEERMQALARACHDAGAKLTPQRIEIYREVISSEEHPDAETIYQGVRRRLPTVSLDTVYRTLWWLSDLGLVATVGPSKERARFDANMSRHHHFVCVRCGLTRDFYSRELDNIELPLSVATIGSIERTQVEVKGVCHSCAARREGKTPEPHASPGRA